MPGDVDYISLGRMIVPLQLNYCQCLLELEEYYEVVEVTTELLHKHKGEDFQPVSKLKARLWEAGVIDLVSKKKRRKIMDHRLSGDDVFFHFISLESEPSVCPMKKWIKRKQSHMNSFHVLYQWAGELDQRSSLRRQKWHRNCCWAAPSVETVLSFTLVILFVV